MTRCLAVLLSLGIAAASCGGAAAQGFFFPWFRNTNPPPPPASVPAQPEAPPAPLAPAPPAPPRPVVAKPIAESSVLGRLLKLNGQDGSLRLDRSGRDEWTARLTLSGSRLSRPGEACMIETAEAVPVALRGRTDGLLRIEVALPSCAIAASVLDGAVWVREPAEICFMEAADCRVDPRGLWGPEPAALVPQARDIEQDRGQADRAVRENYKVLTQRAKPGEMRPIVSEQAAFSSEREMLCRTYRGEGAHGFCNARYSEGRAAQLAARLGLGPSAVAETTSAPARPRRQAPLLPPAGVP